MRMIKGKKERKSYKVSRRGWWRMRRSWPPGNWFWDFRVFSSDFRLQVFSVVSIFFSYWFASFYLCSAD
jgi:hypothetical protein